MKRFGTWSMLLLLVFSVLTFGQGMKAKGADGSGNFEQSIKDLEIQYREAVLKGDVSFLEKYLADNYVRVFGGGGTGNRQDMIDGYRKRTTTITSLDYYDEQVYVSGDTAVVTYKVAGKGTSDRQSFNGNFRILRTWVKQGGQWKILAASTTPIDTAK